MKKRRGRPQKYDVDKALDGALQVFWLKGLSATSMDDLVVAMGMNKPSIYNAFGDKKSIYKRVVKRFSVQSIDQLNQIFINEPDIKEALLKFYRVALDIYFSTPDALSCFIVNTVPVESTKNADIKALLISTIDGIDKAIEQRLIMAQKQGRVVDADAAYLAKLCHGVLQSIAIRARAGEPRELLDQFAVETVSFIVKSHD